MPAETHAASGTARRCPPGCEVLHSTAAREACKAAVDSTPENDDEAARAAGIAAIYSTAFNTVNSFKRSYTNDLVTHLGVPYAEAARMADETAESAATPSGDYHSETAARTLEFLTQSEPYQQAPGMGR